MAKFLIHQTRLSVAWWFEHLTVGTEDLGFDRNIRCHHMLVMADEQCSFILNQGLIFAIMLKQHGTTWFC